MGGFLLKYRFSVSNCDTKVKCPHDYYQDCSKPKLQKDVFLVTTAAALNIYENTIFKNNLIIH